MTGSTFLVLYAGSFTALWLTTALVWRRSQPPVDPAIDETSLDVVELAALNGGVERASFTAMTALRRSHVRPGPGGTMLLDGPLADDAGELERELYDAVRASPSASARTLVDGAARGPAAAATVARVRDAGLLLDAPTTRNMHVLWLCAALLVGVGVAGLLGFELPPALLGLLAALVASSAALLCWIHLHRSGASAAGRRLFHGIGDSPARLRGHADHPAFEVAMSGGVVLWTQDWALASALDIPAAAQEEQRPGLVGEAISWWWFGRDDDGDGCGGCGCG